MNASTLFDALRQRFNLKNDAALCRKLDVAPPAISKARRFNKITDPLMVKLCDAFDMRPEDVRKLGEQ
jgi:plasmid maintenance system antidote protein VapI